MEVPKVTYCKGVPKGNHSLQIRFIRLSDKSLMTSPLWSLVCKWEVIQEDKRKLKRLLKKKMDRCKKHGVCETERKLLGLKWTAIMSEHRQGSRTRSIYFSHVHKSHGGQKFLIKRLEGKAISIIVTLKWSLSR